MALFNNNSAPGPGVAKNAPKKRRVFEFFEVVFQKTPKLFLLGLLFVLFSIPILTVGAALTGAAAVLFDISTRRGTFVWSDFWAAFRRRFLAATALWIADVVAIAAVVFGWLFYFNLKNQVFSIVGLVIFSGAGLILIFSNFYIWLMLARTELRVKQVLKNAFLLSVAAIKTNLLTLLVLLLFVLFAFVLPKIFIICVPLGVLTLMQLVVSWGCAPVVERYVIEKDFSEVEPVFEDNVEVDND